MNRRADTHGGPDAPRGFTMLEVMLSVAILAGLSTMVWVSIDMMFETRDAMQRQSDRYQIIRVALDRMNSEIASAYVAGPTHGAEELFEEQSAPNSKQEAEQKLAQADREPVEFGMRGRDDKLAFTSFAHMRTVADEKSSYHAEIAYFVRSVRNEEGELVDSLMRREDTTIDGDLTQGGKVYTLIPNIEEVEFEYWDPGEVEIGTEEEMGRGRWRDSWDTSQREYHERLPLRVRIKVTLPPIGPRGEEQTFTTQTQIMTHQRLDL